ncbi:MAG TPA: ABC transporter permease [Anaeromyxobacteraceae bacterium]|nr:ABC transporter permease [Anaeromyxobacteraceae bacterium]
MTTHRRGSANRSLVAILVGIVILMSALNPQRFPTLSNVISMAYQLPIIAFLAIGMMVSMLGGGINLAIIATANFTGIVTMLLLRAMAGAATDEASLAISLLAMGGGLGAALLVGAAMGFLIAYVEVPAILATLAVMTLLNGVNVVITRGYTWSGFPPFLLGIGNGIVGGIPIPFLVLLGVCLVLGVVLKRTRTGVSLYLLGSNPVAARYSNVPVRAVLMREYLLSALFSALTAFIMMGQLNSVKANYAESYLLVAVLACFLGGVDPFGGAGTLSGMVLAVVILQLVSTGVNLLRLDPFFIQAMWGFIIVLLIAANHFGARYRERRRLSAVALAEPAGSTPPAAR